MSGHGNGILKPRPMGRAGLSEVIAGLSARATELKFQARWAATMLDCDDDPRGTELLGDSLAMLGDAGESLFELAVGVKLGRFGVRALPDDAASRPLLDLVEERAGREEPTADPVTAMTGGPPVRPRPAPSRTFEVLDRGSGHPGHVQFAAEDEAEAIAKRDESWPGLEVAEVVEPEKILANQKGSDESPKGTSAAAFNYCDLNPPKKPKSSAPKETVREPVISGSSPVPLPGPASDATNDGRKRFIALNAFKKPMVFVRAFTIDAARAMVWREKPHMTLDVIEDLEGLGVASGLTELVADRVYEDEQVTEGIEDGPRAMDGAAAVEPEGSKPAGYIVKCNECGWEKPGSDPSPCPKKHHSGFGYVGPAPSEEGDESEILLVAPPAATSLDTDDLLLLACNRRVGMAERWEAMQRDGATDLEMRAALSRAFDLGVSQRRGAFTVEGGCCSFQGGESPGFWAGKTDWDGRPTLEGKRLVERVRAVLEIPEEAGGTVPRRNAKSRKKPKLFQKD